MQDIRGESLLNVFFDSNTMSVHFKENVHILCKKGKPGNWESIVMDQIPDQTYLNDLIDKLYREMNSSKDGFLEIDKKYSKVLQLGPYRIVIVLPPLSDGIEITVVKPIKKLSIDDYKLEPKILEMLKDKSNGILISGGPGQGKTTFAQALVEMYVKMNKIIKTIESPRDLLVPDEVTQYSFNYAPHNEIRDILLLSRPDYTVYDEVRNTDDFILFKDLRLTGIGLIGIIHATNPIDSIQRFIGTIQMGVIPQIIDTVIYIEAGQIQAIYNLNQVVKIPHGMNSEDLSRPVIQVKDFLEDKVKYEIYTYGEQVVIMPIDGDTIQTPAQSAVQNYAKKYLQEYLNNYYKFPVKIEVNGQNSITVYVSEKHKGGVIGKGGENISKLEEKLGMSISVRTLDEVKTKPDTPNTDINISFERKGKKEFVTLGLSKEMANKSINLMIGDELIELRSDNKATITIKNPSLIKKIQKSGVYLA